ncbi:MAG: cobalamin biosynthesis protein CbiG [Methanoregula sp. PtaU1.Bin051]|nr:MAG: cobalamin biosynthesis protein CbiG [Methanoregula sp. PtaU1.Bin051]
MTGTVVIAFPRSSKYAQKIADHLKATYYPYDPEIFSRVFASADRIIALMATGIVVRSIAPLVRDKWVDPAIVVVSPDLSYAIPLIGGHHGANDLARELVPLGIRPVITTATEALGKEAVEAIAVKEQCEVLNRESTRHVNSAILETDVPVHPINGPAVVIAGPGVSVLTRKGKYVVGIGCRKGVRSGEVMSAIGQALATLGIAHDDVFVYATTVKKLHERGLADAINSLSSGLIFLDDDTVNAQSAPSSSKAGKIGLAGVAEPCAIAISKKKELVMRKTVYGKVTLAIAR